VNAQRHDDHLVTVVMAGSAIEAMLLDYLQRRDVAIEPLLGKPLGALIDVCKPYVAARTYEDAKRLQDHRNRIHPGRSFRENDPEPARPDALLAMAILERLAQDLGAQEPVR
jgi:hypothetical protein